MLCMTAFVSPPSAKATVFDRLLEYYDAVHLGGPEGDDSGDDEQHVVGKAGQTVRILSWQLEFRTTRHFITLGGPGVFLPLDRLPKQAYNKAESGPKQKHTMALTPGIAAGEIDDDNEALTQIQHNEDRIFSDAELLEEMWTELHRYPEASEEARTFDAMATADASELREDLIDNRELAVGKHVRTATDHQIEEALEEALGQDPSLADRPAAAQQDAFVRLAVSQRLKSQSSSKTAIVADEHVEHDLSSYAYTLQAITVSKDSWLEAARKAVEAFSLVCGHGDEDAVSEVGLNRELSLVVVSWPQDDRDNDNADSVHDANEAAHRTS
jgi:hypothetical protein